MKLKVMLVDDELLVRLGIKSLIDWEQHDFEFIGDASDGEKALELMAHQAPDILLTDIVMPRMNGLELIEIVRERYPHTLIIVLSSHNEFDYVRKAMKLGVEDYLLKTSMKPAELLDLLIEASGKIISGQAEPQAHSDMPAATRKDAITRQLQLRLLNERANAAETEPLGPNRVLLLVVVRHAREGEMEPSAIPLLQHLMETELEAVLEGQPIILGNREIVSLIAPPEEEQGGLPSLVQHLIRVSKQLLGLSLSAEISRPLSGWLDIYSAYAAAKATLSEQERFESSRADIKQLLAYIRANIAQDISLKFAADMINISESYLSTIFKKETGSGFTDWINALRIDQAAHYLVDTDLPSYVIAERVGYENINYFGRIFKKLKGVSPQKYRAMHQNE